LTEEIHNLTNSSKSTKSENQKLLDENKTIREELEELSEIQVQLNLQNTTLAQGEFKIKYFISEKSLTKTSILKNFHFRQNNF